MKVVCKITLKTKFIHMMQNTEKNEPMEATSVLKQLLTKHKVSLVRTMHGNALLIMVRSEFNDEVW